MIEICNFIESTNLKLLGFDPNDPIKRSWGFPTGCSLNHCAAHYTPNPGDELKLKKKDICKIDFGTQINGNIIDCAFTMSFDDMHLGLMEAVKAATNAGISFFSFFAFLLFLLLFEAMRRFRPCLRVCVLCFFLQFCVIQFFEVCGMKKTKYEKTKTHTYRDTSNGY